MRAAATLLTILVLAAPTWPLLARAEPGADGNSYRVVPAATGAPSRGWGVYATVHGRSLDLRARGQGWVDDPRTRPGDVQAGLGWRGDHFSTVVGYQEVDYGRQSALGPGVDPMNTGRDHESSQGVLGLGFAFRR
jgi:hypothetical protein